MQRYSLGFVFDASLRQVLLIHKNKPAAQAGKVNGLGGKVEPSEDSRACVMREIREEAGLSTAADGWLFAGTMRSKDWSVDVYGLAYSGNRTDAKTMEDQRVEWFPVDALPANRMSNLSWLVPFVKNKLLERDATPRFLVEYP